MSFYIEILRFEVGEREEQDLPGIAVLGLEEGFDSRNLRILSSYLGARGAGSEIVAVYRRALDELNIEIPDREVLVQHLIEDALRAVVAGEIDPVSGARRVCYELFRNHYLVFDGRLGNQYVGDLFGIEQLYGLIDAYDDLSDATLREQLVNEIAQEAARLLDKRTTKNLRT